MSRINPTFKEHSWQWLHPWGQAHANPGSWVISGRCAWAVAQLHLRNAPWCHALRSVRWTSGIQGPERGCWRIVRYFSQTGERLDYLWLTSKSNKTEEVVWAKYKSGNGVNSAPQNSEKNEKYANSVVMRLTTIAFPLIRRKMKKKTKS